MSATFDRAAIMRAAWAKLNAHFDRRPHLARKFSRADFGFYLSCAWHEARASLLTAAETRAARIEVEIDRLNYQSSRINIEPRRHQLRTELASLAA